MKITPQIKNAIEKSVAVSGNRNQFALMVGVAQNHVARWLDGVSESISDRLYEKIFPHIKIFLNECDNNRASNPFTSHEPAPVFNQFYSMKKYKSYSTSIRIEAELFERIHAIAKNKNTSASEIIRNLIISAIESKKVKSAENNHEEHHGFAHKVLDIIMRAEITPEQKITLYNEISSL